MYAVKKDGTAFRAINSKSDVGADETFSKKLPAPPQATAEQLHADLQSLTSRKHEDVNKYVHGDYKSDRRQLERYEITYEVAMAGTSDAALDAIVIENHEANKAAKTAYFLMIESFRKAVSALIDAGELDKVKAALAVGETFGADTQPADVELALASL